MKLRCRSVRNFKICFFLVQSIPNTVQSDKVYVRNSTKRIVNLFLNRLRLSHIQVRALFSLCHNQLSKHTDYQGETIRLISEDQLFRFIFFFCVLIFNSLRQQRCTVRTAFSMVQRNYCGFVTETSRRRGLFGFWWNLHETFDEKFIVNSNQSIDRKR